MKKYFLLLLLTVLCISAKAQNYKGDGKPYAFYTQVVQTSTTQFWMHWGDEDAASSICDENGKKITFKSPVALMNYMGKRGWECINITNDNDDNTYFYFKKMVTSDEEAKEGLTLKKYSSLLSRLHEKISK